MNENPDNQWYGSKGGEDTKDAIFLLSVERLSAGILVTAAEIVSSWQESKVLVPAEG